ncbi:MAG: hypothetical protein PHP95_08465 [Desulfuromonadaceae bacterium]|nr:hypothetical protein [Desulfuromonadaceae bacterium]MDD2848475.1 hypothetical protein [Desulfuromonadaceae bacterium]MDD4129896.1 hypothetical protein [Desulfuromonadaceae bacterium]
MKKQIITGMFLLFACTILPACAGLQIGGSSDSSSALAAKRHSQVRQSLDQLIAAYEAKNSRQFSDLVSDSYSGEARILATSALRDFSVYHDLSLRYTVNNITFDDTGAKAFVAITFTRSWTDIKTGRTKNETKETSLIFVAVEDIYKLQSQRGPRLFGLN